MPKTSPLENYIMTQVCLKVGADIINRIYAELGIYGEDIDCFQDQIEMDNLGYGFNSKR